MSDNITLKDLESRVKTINELTGNEPTAYSNKPGQYSLDGAYGGWKLVKITSGGGCQEITSGYVSKRELFNRLQGICTGLYIARDLKKQERP